MGFRHVNDREPSFIAHLPGPHLTRSCRAFSTTFKTTVFSQRPLPWFRAFFRKTALEGQQTSISHAAPQSTRPPFPSRLASCVRVHKPAALLVGLGVRELSVGPRACEHERRKRDEKGMAVLWTAVLHGRWRFVGPPEPSCGRRL